MQSSHTCQHGERTRLSHTERSYLSRRLLTNPWPCVKKTTANKLQPLTREHAQFPVSSNERQNGRTTEAATFNKLRPITLSSTSPRTRSLGTRQPSVPSLGTFQNAVPSLSRRTATLVTNFCIFTVGNNGVNISVVYYLLLYIILAYCILILACSILTLACCIHVQIY